MIQAKVISSGSEGNAVIYNNAIMVDCGVSLKALEAVKHSLKIVLLTHKHSDHLKIRTLQRLQAERPTLRVACGNFLLEELPCIKNIDVLQVGKIYDYGAFKVSPIKLYHDVPMLLSIITARSTYSKQLKKHEPMANIRTLTAISIHTLAYSKQGHLLKQTERKAARF